MAIREIARRTGLSRNTFRKYLGTDFPQGYHLTHYASLAANISANEFCQIAEDLQTAPLQFQIQTVRDIVGGITPWWKEKP
jgi:hypothetical protein